MVFVARACAAALLGLLAAHGCSSDGGDSNRSPVLAPVKDQQASVDHALSFSVRGSDPEGAKLSFSFSSDSEGVTERATLTPAGDDAAIFSFTPWVTDIGTLVVDFTVSDGKKSDTLAVTIEVSGSSGGGVPLFRKPLGTGTTLDLARIRCVEVPIEIEDPDSAGVEIGETEPRIEGSELLQDTGLTATWSFCPTPEQIAAEDLYTLRLYADDGENARVEKTFVIVLRKVQKSGCAGEAPVIEHAATDHSGVGEVMIEAHVTDDVGIKYEPLLLYALADPGDPPDLAMMTQISLTQESGDSRDGQWIGQIPNPVAAQEAGASASLYYILVARDDDDAAADCDHLTQVPARASYVITVSNPGGEGGLAACEPCSADAQCGGEDDMCVQIEGAGRCLVACGLEDACPADTTCSASALTSENGAQVRQCVPDSGSCEVVIPPPVCMDDAFEDNDTRMTAKPFPAGNELLVSCPFENDDDEDWFEINVTTQGELTLELLGEDATDLDLQLYDNAGAIVDRSVGTTSEEVIVTCVMPGKYTARVFAYGSARNEYILEWSVDTSACAAPMCEDDEEENDDTAVQARIVELDLFGMYTSTTNAICGGDEDWYNLDLVNGDTLYATLTFEQTASDEDLDIVLYRGSTALIQCDEFDSSGCSNNGQSTNSNEALVYNITTSGVHYLVVRGWMGAENLYDICVGLAAGDCP